MHSAHQWSSDFVIENFLLGHEPYIPLNRQGSGSGYCKIKIAHMVDRKDRATFAWNVLVTFKGELQTQILPKTFNQADYWGIDKISHGLISFPWLACINVLLDMKIEQEGHSLLRGIQPVQPLALIQQTLQA